jgi:hypothetical protein
VIVPGNIRRLAGHGAVLALGRQLGRGWMDGCESPDHEALLLEAQLTHTKMRPSQRK